MRERLAQSPAGRSSSVQRGWRCSCCCIPPLHRSLGLFPTCSQCKRENRSVPSPSRSLRPARRPPRLLCSESGFHSVPGGCSARLGLSPRQERAVYLAGAESRGLHAAASSPGSRQALPAWRPPPGRVGATGCKVRRRRGQPGVAARPGHAPLGEAAGRGEEQSNKKRKPGNTPQPREKNTKHAARLAIGAKISGGGNDT